MMTIADESCPEECLVCPLGLHLDAQVVMLTHAHL